MSQGVPSRRDIRSENQTQAGQNGAMNNRHALGLGKLSLELPGSGLLEEFVRMMPWPHLYYGVPSNGAGGVQVNQRGQWVDSSDPTSPLLLVCWASAKKVCFKYTYLMC